MLIQPEHTLLTVTEAAKYLRLSTSCLNAKHALGTGPIRTKLGKRVYYQLAMLDAFINEHTQVESIPVKVQKPKPPGTAWITTETDYPQGEY